MHKLNKLIFVLLLLLVLLSGFNFFNQFKIASIPLFQSLFFLIIIILVITAKKFYKPKLKGVKYYEYYLYLSLPPFVIGMINTKAALFTYMYSIFPFLLFLLTFKKLDYMYYRKLLIGLNISMLLVTLAGWLIRLGYIDFDFFFTDVIESQYALGYWGLRYIESTRNADYLYPLIGLVISMYFYIDKRNIVNLVLIFIFILTLIASESRAALIISILSLLFIFTLSNKKTKILFIFILISVISLNYEFLYNMFTSKFELILLSIFSLESIDYKFSNTSRLNIIQYALTASAFNPIGYGIDNYSSIYHIFNFDGRVSYSAENAFLTILVERGWFALFFFLFALLAMLKKAYQRKKITLNKILIPMLLVYFFFNYEFNNVFANFIFYIVLIDYYITSKKGFQ